jgi:hypothetical protein
MPPGQAGGRLRASRRSSGEGGRLEPGPEGRRPVHGAEAELRSLKGGG